MKHKYIPEIGQTIAFPDDMTDAQIASDIRDYIIPQAKGEPPPTSVMGHIKEAGKGFLDAIPRGGLSALRGVASLVDDSAPSDPNVWVEGKTAYDVRQARKAYNQSTAGQALAASPGYEDSYARMGGSALGSIIPLLATSAIGGTGPALALAMMQGAGNQGENIDQQRAAGRDISARDELLATLGGGAIGATEMLPLGRLTGPLRNAVMGGVGKAAGRTAAEVAKRGAAGTLASMGIQALEEGGQEAGSQLLNNLVEQQTYNDKRGLGEGVVQSGLLGAVVGGGLDGTLGRLARKIEARQIENQQEPTKYNQYALPSTPGTERYVDALQQIFPAPPKPQPAVPSVLSFDGPYTPDAALLDFYGQTVPSKPQATINAPESIPQVPAPQSSQRRRKQGIEVPETGVDEQVARAVAAREDIARQFGRKWEDLSNSERVAIDDLIAEGNTGSPTASYSRRPVMRPQAPPPNVAGASARVAPSMPQVGPEASVRNEVRVGPQGVSPVGVEAGSFTRQQVPNLEEGLSGNTQQDPPPSKPQTLYQAEGYQAPAVPPAVQGESLQPSLSGSAQSQPQDTAAWQAQAKGVVRPLRAFMDRVGAKDLNLRLIDRIEDRISGKLVEDAKGSYERGLVQIAYTATESPESLIGTTGHEITHGFKEAGLFTAPELATLEKQVQRDGTLAEIQRDEYYGKLTPEQQKEEAIAHAFERFVVGELKGTSQTAGLFNRAKNFLGRMHAGFKGQGFLTAQDVMDRFDQGDIGRRDRPGGVEVPAAGIRVNGNTAAVNSEPEQPAEATAPAPVSNQNQDLPDSAISGIGDQSGVEGGETMYSRRPQDPNPPQGQPLSRKDSGSQIETQERIGRVPQGVAQPQSTPQDRIFAMVSPATGTGKAKSIADMRAESGLSREQFDQAFVDLVKSDRIQSSRGDMKVERMLQDGLIREDEYVLDPGTGRPYLTASREDAGPPASQSASGSSQNEQESRTVRLGEPAAQTLEGSQSKDTTPKGLYHYTRDVEGALKILETGINPTGFPGYVSTSSRPNKTTVDMPVTFRVDPKGLQLEEYDYFKGRPQRVDGVPVPGTGEGKGKDHRFEYEWRTQSKIPPENITGVYIHKDTSPYDAQSIRQAAEKRGVPVIEEPIDKAPMYSKPLRSTNQAVRAEYEKVFGQVEHPTLIDKIKSVFESKESIRSAITLARQETFDGRARIAEGTRLTAKTDADLMADRSAEAAVRFADRSSNVFAGALTHGPLKYDKGYVTAQQGKGLLRILDPLVKANLTEEWALYMAAKRGGKLLTEGKERLMTQPQITQAMALAQQHPELLTAENEYNTWNKALVQLLVDTGRIDQPTADKWTSGTYLPFYRLTEDEIVTGPRASRTIAGGKKIEGLKGGSSRINDPLTNIIQNGLALTDIAMKNVAAQRTIRDAVSLGWARPAVNGDKGAIVTVYRGGKAIKFKVEDQLLYDAMTQSDLPSGPLFDAALGFMRGGAQMLRGLVTKSPTFFVKNTTRDSLESWMKGGHNVTPILSAIDGVRQVMGNSKNYEALERAGVIGGTLLEGGAEGTADRIQRKLDITSGASSKMKQMWDALGEASDKSEAVNRVKIYEDAMARHGNEAQAAYEALEVMNFSRQGRSAAIRLLSAMIPFFNARLQGLDWMGRALAGHAYGFDAANGGRGSEIRKNMIRRGLFMAGVTATYALLMADNDEWKNASPEERANNWFIPMGGGNGALRVPIPFELGFIFKTLPEDIMANMMKVDTDKQTMKYIGTGIMNQLMQPLVPQAVKPLVENFANYSFFKGREIENGAQKRLLPEHRSDDYTSELAKFIGEQSGSSPLKIDNVLKGYTGTIGTITLQLLDGMMREGKGEPPERALWQIPGISSFIQRPDGARQIIDFYESSTGISQVAQSMKLLRQSDPAKLSAFIKEHQKELMLENVAEDTGRRMTDLRKLDKTIRNHPTMPGADKRKMLDEIRQRQIQLTKPVNETIRKVSN
jgi:hypothetical protein